MATTTKKKNVNTKPTRKKGKKGDDITIGEAISWFCGAVIFLSALVMTISETSHLMADTLPNWLGECGDWVWEHLFTNTFGLATYFVPLFLLILSLRIFKIGKPRVWKWFINCAFLMIWCSLLLAFLQYPHDEGGPGLWETLYLAGGLHGKDVLSLLVEKIGIPGTALVLAGAAVLYVLYLSGETVRTMRRLVKTLNKGVDKVGSISIKTPSFGSKSAPVTEEKKDEAQGPTANVIEFGKTEDEEQPADTDPFNEMEIKVGEEEEAVTTEEEPHEGDEDEEVQVTLGTDDTADVTGEVTTDGLYDPKLDLENYKFPTLDLLKKVDVKIADAVDMDEQEKNQKQIKKVLSDFGVEIKHITATVGPTVTLYELTPADGVRITKIRGLEDDIALRLRALGIRIIAPMPGKGTIGIEVPNAKPQLVSMESIINSRKFQETDFELPMALGKTITNEVFMVDLTKMPHLLVAGATGQGKSVGLNAIITSLLYKKHPAELKLVMVDPKKVEFSVYAPIVNHFLAQVEGNEDTEDPIITDVHKVIQTLKSLCQEMDTRYDLLKSSKTRNVKEYNTKFKARKLNPEKGHKFMPYIVVIIDEFGELIMTAGKEIELPIARLAQMGRAVGLHMIIATQRPSVNIVTGLIKANFPARMAFKVSSMVESKIILDRPGANNLVGKGDMLISAGNEPVRVQCAFVDTPEVEDICNFIACQQSYDRPFPLPLVEMDNEGGDSSDVDSGKLDPMFDEVARLVVSTQQGSTSAIQRKFSIGYNRAGRLMDQLEQTGIVGPAHGSKPREVLCLTEQELEYKLANLH